MSRPLKSHLGIKVYVCSDCGKAFTEKIYRDDHYNMAHSGLKNYPCEHCPKPFASYNNTITDGGVAPQFTFDGTGSILGGTGQYLVVLGHFWVVLVSTWWYWVNIGWYWSVLCVLRSILDCSGQNYTQNYRKPPKRTNKLTFVDW